MDDTAQLRNLLKASLARMEKHEADRVEKALLRLEKAIGNCEKKYTRAIQDRQAVHSLLKRTSDDQAGKRRKIEKELQDTTDLLAGILRASPVGFHKTDTAGRIVYVNETWSRITGYPRENAIGKYYADFVYPDDREQLIQGVRKCADRQEDMAVDTRIIRPDGTVRWIAAQAVPLTGPGNEIAGWVGAIRDVTQVREAEEALRKSEIRFRELADLLPETIFEMDTGGKLSYVNAFGQEVFGLTEEVLRDGINAFSLMVPEDRPRALGNLPLNSAGWRRNRETYTLLTKTGNRMTVYLRVAPVIRDGEVTGYRGIAGDVSELKRTEGALHESREKYRMLAENTPDLHFSSDIDGLINYVSPQIRQYGLAPEDVVGKSAFSFIHPSDKDEAMRKVGEDFKTSLHSTAVFRIIGKEGDIRWVEQKATLVTDAEGQPRNLFGVLRDITERKKAEAAIELANRKLNLMNNITRHDILNTVTGIFGCVDMLRAGSPDPENDQLLADIKDQVRVIQRQIMFTKEYQEVGIRMPQWQDVSTIIGTVLKNFEKLPFTYSMNIGKIEVYADPLFEKVIYNLVDNAARYAVTATCISFSTWRTGTTLVLVCEDNGAGIAADQKERIFERGIGKNTGMGLFLTREILEITGISIRETGIKGEGARFELHIPLGGYREPEA